MEGAQLATRALVCFLFLSGVDGRTTPTCKAIVPPLGKWRLVNVGECACYLPSINIAEHQFPFPGVDEVAEQILMAVTL